MNSTLSLVRYAKLENGWRRGKIIKQPNGKIKHPFMQVGGVATEAPQGRYQILRYEGTRPIYNDLGNEPSEAMSRFKAEVAKAAKRAEAIKAAEKAGLRIEEEKPVEGDGVRSLASLRTDFLEMHANLPHRSNDSLSRYTLVTRTFLEKCRAKYPTQVKIDDVTRWAGYIQQELGYADRGRSNMYTDLRSFLRYCDIDPVKLIPKGNHKLLKAYTQKKPNQYTPEQVAALIDAALDDNEALLWDFAHKVGPRDSELKMITRDDLYGLTTKEATVHIRERDEYGNIKDAEERVIELHKSLVPRLKKWLKDNPDLRLLFGTESDKPNEHLLRTLKRTAHRAKLNCGRCEGCKKFGRNADSGCEQFTLHKFRRTFGTTMLKATKGDLPAVMLRAGWSDAATAMRYMAPAESVRKALDDAF
jgi:integrase